MAKNKVRFIKPGSIAQQVPKYEKQRRQKIEFNNIRLAKRGFERMANSLVGLKKKGKTKNTKEAKNMRAMDIDDDEYQPLEDENNLSFDDDHLTFYSDEEEIIDFIMNERRKKNVVTQHTSTPHTEMPPIESTMAPTPTQELPVQQDSLSATPGSLPQHMVRASTSTRFRGATRGINTERLIAANNRNKLVVEVPPEVGSPVGENATRFATWLGVQIRMAAPLKGMEKWDDIPPACKAPIIQAARDKFDILEYDEKEHVRRGINNKCQKLYRTWRHNMKEHYKELLEAGKNPYSKPYRGVKDEDWAWMIENIWTNKDKEEIVKQKKKARASLPFHHTSK